MISVASYVPSIGTRYTLLRNNLRLRVEQLLPEESERNV